MSTDMAFKFLTEGGVGPNSGFQWPLPNGKPGAWVSVKGTLKACSNGIHACTLAQAPQWVSHECYVVELGGKVIDHGDKLVARKGRLIRRVEEWNDTTARLFAADCAEHVLPIYEKRYPKDKRPRQAIHAARAYAKHPTEGNRRKRDAARTAAGTAARAAAGAAARTAAWTAAWTAAGAAGDAAWTAARAAARAAAGAAARAAAWDAAGAAARAAEREWQANRLRELLNVPEVDF